jgi:hypothetical protein
MNSPKKHPILKDTVMGAVLTGLAAMSLSGTVFAQEPNRSHRGWSYHHREKGGRESFVMGVCVGQTLAQRGVTLPMPEPGRPPALDSSQEEAMQSAVETCRASMSGRSMQSPTPAPTAAPTSVPPTAPVTSPTSLGSTAAPSSAPETPAPAVTVTESPSAASP